MIVSKQVSSLAVVLAATPAAALAQAAINSDTPVPHRSAEPGGAAAVTRQESPDPTLLPTPNPTTAPGSPGTTGTGAAGTGPTNTMAAPGR